MTPQRAKELLPVIEAYANSKPVQSRNTSIDSWVDDASPDFDDVRRAFRIKPTPREFWVNLFGRQEGVENCISWHDSKDAADNRKTDYKHFIRTIHLIEVEEK